MVRDLILAVILAGIVVTVMVMSLALLFSVLPESDSTALPFCTEAVSGFILIEVGSEEEIFRMTEDEYNHYCLEMK